MVSFLPDLLVVLEAYIDISAYQFNAGDDRTAPAGAIDLHVIIYLEWVFMIPCSFGVTDST
jgi:hypothetical protein